MPTTLTVKIGNLLNVSEGHIVHGCNAQGVMGSGVALGVKNTYPAAYQDYVEIHKTQGLQLGIAYPYLIHDNLCIWNAITQDTFGSLDRNVSYDAIETCFKQINQSLSVLETIPQEIHIPKIGAARGGGNWQIIKTIIEETVDWPVTLWLPDNTVNTL